jgi:hypothetical protein
MPLRYYKCPLCGYERETLRNRVPQCNHNQEEEGIPVPLTAMEEIITAPDAKMMEVVDKNMGKSRIKDQMKILKERSRNYARDVEADDMIQMNQKNGIERSGFLNKEGKRRTKLDDK